MFVHNDMNYCLLSVGPTPHAIIIHTYTLIYGRCTYIYKFVFDEFPAFRYAAYYPYLHMITCKNVNSVQRCIAEHAASTHIYTMRRLVMTNHKSIGNVYATNISTHMAQMHSEIVYKSTFYTWILLLRSSLMYMIMRNIHIIIIIENWWCRRRTPPMASMVAVLSAGGMNLMLSV